MTIKNDISPAKALLQNQQVIKSEKKRIELLIKCVNSPNELNTSQWIQIMAFLLEFKPDLILELGRGYGNSTCVFIEVCHLLSSIECNITSICQSLEWNQRTVPCIKRSLGDQWFKPLNAITTDIRDFDYDILFSGKKRIVIFWDAHGFEVAETVLGKILPLIKDKPHLVIMHDISDTRYNGDGVRYYGENGLWKGKNNCTGPRVHLGHINSCVEQSVAIVDFCSRNMLTLHSSDESYHTEISDENWEKLIDALGNDYVSKNGHWFWFTLNEAAVEITFPKVIAHNRSREKQIPGVINLNIVELASKNAKIEKIQDGLKIRTPVEPWAYAAFFPINKKGSEKNSLTAEIEVQVIDGVISVGFLSSDDKKIIDEKFIPKNERIQSIEIFTLDGDGVKGIIIRNGSLDNSVSQGIITRLETE